MAIYSYAGRMLRINLSEGKFTDEPLDRDFMAQYIGGAGFGAKYLYEEHPWTNAATHADLSVTDMVRLGKRMVNILRVFNIKNGLTKDLEAPSTRYGSAPIDGPAKGLSLAKNWGVIQEVYYRMMGWDPQTGKPTPETLKDLGLEDLIPALETAVHPKN